MCACVLGEFYQLCVLLIHSLSPTTVNKKNINQINLDPEPETMLLLNKNWSKILLQLCPPL